MILTDAQRELLEDKYVLWERASREGSMDSRDYNRRAAEALKVALAIVSEGQPTAIHVGELRQALTGCAHGLRSYQYGNASTDLAKGLADHAEAFLAQATGANP